MHSLKISNKCLTKWRSCMIPTVIPSITIPAPISTFPTTLTFLSSLHAQRGSSWRQQVERDKDGQRVSLCHLRGHETKFGEEVLRQKYHDDSGPLRDPARSATTLRPPGSSLRRLERFHLNVSKPHHLVADACTSRFLLPHRSMTSLSGNHEDVFFFLQQVQFTAEYKPDGADCLLWSRLPIDVGEVTSSSVSAYCTEGPPSGSSQLPDPKTPSTRTFIHGPEHKVLDVPQVSSLMSSAHDGDASALHTIRTLITSAIRSSPRKRSAAQKYLLQYWKKPCLRQIFVDASRRGIGFVFNERWLAWHFVNNQKRQKLTTCWAELTAVELAIRTLIAATYRHVPLTVRSDHDGVVRAFEARRWKTKPKLDKIVRQILSLCDEAGLRLQVEWVPSKDNLADKPSRGDYPSRELSFQYRPSIPIHLDGLIEEVE